MICKSELCSIPNISKKSKPYSEGEFVMECLEWIIEILCPGKEKDFSNISGNRQTITMHVIDIEQLTEYKFKRRTSEFLFCTLALHESTDMVDYGPSGNFYPG